MGYGLGSSDFSFEQLKLHPFFEGIDFEKIKAGKLAVPMPEERLENAFREEEKQSEEFLKHSDTRKEREMFSSMALDESERSGFEIVDHPSKQSMLGADDLFSDDMRKAREEKVAKSSMYH